MHPGRQKMPVVLTPAIKIPSYPASFSARARYISSGGGRTADPISTGTALFVSLMIFMPRIYPEAKGAATGK